MQRATTTPTALLLVDIQEGFKHPTHWGRSLSTPPFEANVAALLGAARAHNRTSNDPARERFPVQIIHVHHHSNSSTSPLHPSHYLPGSSRPSVAALPFTEPLPDEPVIIKHFNSAFVGTDLESRLRAARVRQLVVVGLTTDHCVSTTARMAANLQVLGGRGGADGTGEGNHGVVVVRDATATHGRAGFDAETVHAVSLASLDGEFAHVAETAAVLTAVFPAVPIAPVAAAFNL